LPSSGFKAADAPSFERYDETFDPVTGDGGFEIWVPISS
jgi:AraC family transcriptional regulator